MNDLNHKGIEDTEKKKKRQSNPVRLGLKILLLVMLLGCTLFLPAYGYYIPKRLEFELNKYHWQSKHENVLVMVTHELVDGDIITGWDDAYIWDDSQLFQRSLDCIKSRFCRVIYHDDYHLPIQFQYINGMRLRVEQIMYCSDLLPSRTFIECSNNISDTENL